MVLEWTSDATFIKMFAGFTRSFLSEKDVTVIKAVHRGQSSIIRRVIKKAKRGSLGLSLKTYFRLTLSKIPQSRRLVSVCILRVLNLTKTALVVPPSIGI